MIVYMVATEKSPQQVGWHILPTTNTHTRAHTEHDEIVRGFVLDVCD